MRRAAGTLALFTLPGILVVFLSFGSASALIGSSGGGPHPICVAWMAMPPPKPPPPFCSEPSPQGPVPGICTGVICKATGAPGLGGGNMLDSALQALQGLLQQLMQKQGGGQPGGEGSGGALNTTQLYPNCTNSPLTGGLVVVPCTDSTGAVVTTSTSSSTLFASGSLGDTASTLLGTLYGSSTPQSALADIASQTDPIILASQNTNPQFGTTSVSTQITPIIQTVPYVLPPAPLPGSQVFISGGSGDVLVQNGIATVVARVRESTSESSGFFGGVPAPSLCSSRPWTVATGIISPAFFDSLCVWRGYTVQ